MKKLGTKAKTTVYHSFDELPEADKKYIREREKHGKKVRGWYENGDVDELRNHLRNGRQEQGRSNRLRQSPEGERNGRSIPSRRGDQTIRGRERASLLQARIAKHIDNLVKKLGTKARTTVYHSLSELPEADRKYIERAHRQGRKVRGWYENGRIYLFLPDIGRKYESAHIVAPITINGERYVCSVILHKNKKNNRFYLHEVTSQKNLQDEAFVTNLAQKPASSGDVAKVIQNILNTKESSKILDKNNEPLVVYHGTNLTRVNHSAPFWEFYDNSHFGTIGQTNSVLKHDTWTPALSESSKNRPQEKSITKIYQVFLNIRNPKRTKDVPEDENLSETDRERINNILNEIGYGRAREEGARKEKENRWADFLHPQLPPLSCSEGLCSEGK